MKAFGCFRLQISKNSHIFVFHFENLYLCLNSYLESLKKQRFVLFPIVIGFVLEFLKFKTNFSNYFPDTDITHTKHFSYVLPCFDHWLLPSQDGLQVSKDTIYPPLWLLMISWLWLAKSVQRNVLCRHTLTDTIMSVSHTFISLWLVKFYQLVKYDQAAIAWFTSLRVYDGSFYMFFCQ